MSNSHRVTLLCRYQYDPLDRLAGCTPLEQANIQRFYCKSRLSTEVQDAVQRCIFQYDDQLLAQHQQSGAKKVETSLLATDQQRSVLITVDAIQPHPLAYTPYGHRPAQPALLQRRTARPGDRALSFGEWVSAVQSGVDAV